VKKRVLAGALMATIGTAQASSVTPLLTHDLTGLGKDGQMNMVTLAPGEVGAPHRHNADVFVYVLSGAMVMQVKGGPLVTLHAGQTFYESPADIHVVSRNASKTEPAKFLAFFVKDKGAPNSVPVK
jgi:quercetin dioxygenase-like cupin family protein